jgi:hypothetical protein
MKSKNIQEADKILMGRGSLLGIGGKAVRPEMSYLK